MKRLVPSIFAILFTISGFCQDHPNTVNAMIGDISFTKRFGQSPDVMTPEILRIQTHLYYVVDLLRNKDVSDLSPRQKKNREKIIALLHQYTLNGVFPKNLDYKERRPCFIDSEGNICAVGYLVEKTAGRNVAEKINSKHKYDFLMDMNEAVIVKWAKENGLTLEECATIQPSYGSIPSGETVYVPLKPAYGTGSGLLGGANIGISILNLKGSGRPYTKTLSYVGLVTGTSQVILGLANIRKDEVTHSLMYPPTTTSYKAQNNLSYLNIAAGTTTIITSAFNLFVNSKVKDKRNAFNLYSYPDQANKMVAGLSFSRSL